MELINECKMMLKLAITSLQRAGHDTEHFEKTVAKIEAQQQVKNCSIPDVSGLVCGHEKTKKIRNKTIEICTECDKPLICV